MRTKFNGILTLLLALTVQFVFAQKTVTGNVSDEAGPLPGVSILIKGTTTGTETDFDGNYTLQAKQGDVLVFSYVGMETVEKIVGASNVVNVTMVASSENVLEEVVITALGIPKKVKAVGYDSQSVKGEIVSETKESNLVNSLSGKVAGVQVTNSSGAVGSSSRITLRGASSIFGDNQPLFIIDGVPVSNDNNGTASSSGGFDLPNAAADINPEDIENLEVLKGPGATALYGIRAANGVIIITTKKGSKNQALGVEVNTSISFSKPLVLPDFQNSYGQGNDPYYFEYVNGSTGSGDGVDESWGPALDRGLEFMQFTSYINNPNNPQPEPWVSHPDNVKNFYNTGLAISNNIALTSGDENGSFRLGLGLDTEDGMIPFTEFKKINVSTAASRDFGSKLKANFGIKYIKSFSDNLPSGGYDGANVVQQTIWSARQVDLEALKDFNNLPKALDGSVFGEGVVPINWMTRFQNNPYWQLATNTNSFNRDRVIGNAGLSYKLLENLTLSANIGVDYYNTLSSVKLAKGSAADAPTFTRFGGNRDGSKGYYDEDNRYFMESNMDFLLNYRQDITENLDLSLNFGGNRMYRKTAFTFNGVQIELPELYNLSNVLSGSTMLTRNAHSKMAINSLYGTGEFSYKNYLFLNFTARNDWASVLPTKNNSFFYPSVSLSAILSDALGFKSDTFNYFKIRGNWAKVGGFGPLGPSDIINTYVLSSVPWDGLTFASASTVLNNPEIKSQTTKGYEFGFDANFLKNRIRLGVTAYNQNNYDLVIPVQVTTASGYSNAWDNLGELLNKGVEVQFGVTAIKNEKKNVSLDFDFNWGKNNNEVISAGTDPNDDSETIILGGQWNMNLEAREGYPYGVIVGSSLERTESGDVIYNNGLPVIGDNIVLGDIQPDWTGGVNMTFKWKNLTFGTLVDAKMGGDVYSMTNAWGRYSGVLAETVTGREGGIVGNGVMNVGTAANPEYVPNNVVVTAEQFNKNAFGNDLVETSVFDASYVKLRQVSLGYHLPKNWMKNVGFDDINVTLIGRNLAILYKNAPHIDPETGFSNANGNQGQEFGQLPSARTYSVNVSLKF